MKITCVIVDDELKACQLIEGLLKNIPDIEVLGYFTDPKEARLHVLNSSPDIIFLDINMPGLTGLEFVDSLKIARVQSKVVFVTGLDTFTIEAIRREAFDYILKPVTMDSLLEMICRYMGNQIKQVSSKDLCYGKLRFNTLQGFFLIDVADIVYVKADGNYSIVNLNDGSSKIITQNLGHIEARLSGFSFFRMDRSLIINIKYVSHINRKDHTCTLAFNGSVIDFPVNRIRVKQLAEIFT